MQANRQSQRLWTYLSEHRDAEQTAKLVKKAGRHCVIAPGDLSDEEFCRTLVRRCVSELGGLDVLVNNAAHQRTSENVEDFSSEEFDKTFRTNVYAMFHLCKQAMPHLPEGGTNINVASIQAYQPLWKTPKSRKVCARLRRFLRSSFD